MKYIFSLFFFILSSVHLAYAQGIVVSIHPLYLIAKEVTQGIEQPTLLLSPQNPGHDIQLSPKNRQQIQNADLIIWLGKQHEVALSNTLLQQKKAVAILDYRMIKTLPKRDLKGQFIPNTVDTHVWLEPNNAIRIAFFIAALRSQQNPKYKEQYWQNATRFSQQLLTTSQNVYKTAKEKHYWAYHDAYGYLERNLKLQFAGALTTDPEITPTITQLQYLNRNRPYQEMCILMEPHGNQALLQRLQPVKTLMVDEAMARENNFIVAWKKLVQQIQQCVG